MEKVREVFKVFTGRPTIEGAGVRLRRVFGYDQVPLFDPFLMLDIFDSENPADYMKGFPWHPHRGIETVSYIISGGVEHGDSMGNRGVISDGQCQWMTAGSGIIHQEMPVKSRHLQGIQLWVNLAANNKMIKPFYQDIKCDEIPVVNDSNGTVRVVAGNYGGIEGPVKGISVKPAFLDVLLKSNMNFEFNTDEGDTVFAYLLDGNGRFSNDMKTVYEAGNAVLFDKGDKIVIEAGGAGLHFLLVVGTPIKEKVAWSGPIVMNTEEELEKAFNELDAGTFIKK